MSIESLESLVDRLQETEIKLRALPDSERWQAEVKSLQKRITSRQKIVAVFGAFSAGKSSLLNALLEDSVLAVSPNPTTAAVTHIQGDIEGTGFDARVFAKTHDEMWDDVLQAFTGIHREAVNLEDAMQQAKSLKIADFSPRTRKYVSFLTAAAAGYEHMGPRLSTNWLISRDEISQYTANESYACYLTRVDLVSDSVLTRDGFVLVDTPGVDSIHRRHTDVAFDYMRKADAVVFVLYYTHAFSRADKDFLTQLAGVQDVVGTDKLFVVINAVDLAKSSEERLHVQQRVIAELRQAGIRAPRVFEVSSQLGFAANRLEKYPDDTTFTQLARLRLQRSAEEALPTVDEIRAMSGMDSFSASLTQFVNEEREQLVRKSILRTLSDIASQIEAKRARLENLQTQDAASRAQFQADVNALKTRLDALASSIQTGAFAQEQMLLADWKELEFHSGERIRLKFSQLFREAFHPGRFRDAAKAKLQLQDATSELQNMIERQIEMEVRTFSMRVEAKLADAIMRLNYQLNSELTAVGLESTELFDVSADSMRHSLGLADMVTRATLSVLPIQAGFRYFSSAKQFFEGGGQATMLQSVEGSVVDEAKRVLSAFMDVRTREAIAWFRAHAVDAIQTVCVNLTELFSDDHASVTVHQFTSYQAMASWFSSMQASVDNPR